MKIIPAARWSAVALLLTAAIVAPTSAAHAAPVACVAPIPSTTQPGYSVADPNCDLNGTPFQPLIDASGNPVSKTYAAIENGAAFRMEVPLAWNGELVVYAHGFRGTGTTVFVDNPGLRAHYVARGFAWAASSYQTNGYDVGQGVRDSHALIAQFARVHGKAARKVFMTGASMGGHITAVAIERFRRSFVAAMPYCGVLGDAELFDYFLDATVTAAALSRVPGHARHQPRRTTRADPDRPAVVGRRRAALRRRAARLRQLVRVLEHGDEPGAEQRPAVPVRRVPRLQRRHGRH
jgi:dienelactone hydrolase